MIVPFQQSMTTFPGRHFVTPNMSLKVLFSDGINPIFKRKENRLADLENIQRQKELDSYSRYRLDKSCLT